MGEGRDTNGVLRGWVWRPGDGAFVFLSGADAGAYGISAAGAVVGRCGARACLWPASAGTALSYGEPIDLNGSIDRTDIQLGQALQINTSGQIVTTGSVRSNPLEGSHIYLLTPK